MPENFYVNYVPYVVKKYFVVKNHLPFCTTSNLICPF